MTDGKGNDEDQYSSARAWCLVGKKDSAFLLLERLANDLNYTILNRLIIDPDLSNLHNEKEEKQKRSIELRTTTTRNVIWLLLKQLKEINPCFTKV